VRQLAAAFAHLLIIGIYFTTQGGSKLPHSKGFAAQWKISLEFGLPTIS
jgi:hypothetical protein